MAKDLMSPHVTQAQADEALDQMFGYYARETRPAAPAANSQPARVVSELDAAAAILAARRAA